MQFFVSERQLTKKLLPMRKLFILCVSLFIGTFISCEKSETEPVETKWTIETIDNTGSPTAMNRLAVDKAQGVHVAYIDENSTDKNKIKYAYKKVGSTWATEFVDNDANCDAWVDIAVDTIVNKIYVVYVKNSQPMTGGSSDENLILAEKTIGTSVWTKTIVQNTLNNSRYPRIAIDKNSGVHISYSRGGHGDLYYAYRANNGTFNYELVADGDCNSAILIDNSLNVHIVYYKSDAVKHATKIIGGTQWILTDIKTNLNYGSSATSSIALSLDKLNNIFAAFINNESQTNNCVGMATIPAGGSWSSNILSHVEKSTVFSLNMCISNTNAKYISYKDNVGLSGQHFDLRVTYQISGTWKTQMVDGNSDKRCGGYSAIGVDNKQGVHVSYTADTDKVLKYAYKSKIE